MDAEIAGPDHELLQRWQRSGDAEAFAALVQRHAGMVYATCRRILRNHHEAEDLAQECFLVLTRRPPRSGRRLGPWLHTVAVRRSLNRIKSDSRRAKREVAAYAGKLDEAPHEWAELQAEVDAAIEQLPRGWRELVVLHYLEGLTHAQLAEHLGVPRTTVSSRLRRGVALIREHLGKRGVTLSLAAAAEGLATLHAPSAPAAVVSALGKLALAGSPRAPVPWLPAASSTLRRAAAAAAVAILALGAAYVAISRSPAARPAADESAGESARRDPAVLADAARPPTASETVAPSGAGIAPRAEVEMPGPGKPLQLQVEVRGADGAPIAGATVAAGEPSEEPWQGARYPVREEDPNALPRATTDERGIAEFDSLGNGDRIAAAYKPGVGWAVKSGIAPGGGPVLLELKPFASIHLRLYDKATGQGVSDLKMKFGIFGTDSWDLPMVRQHLRELDLSRSTPASDADGWYRISNVLPQTYSIEFAGDTTFAVPPSTNLSLEPGESRELEYALGPGASIGGIVVDSQARPLEQARVYYRPNPYFSLGDRIQLRTGADGRFTFTGLTPGLTYELVAEHPSYAPKTLTDLRISKPAEHRDLVIELAIGQRITGRVVDDQGQPIDRLTVMLYKLADRADTDAAGYFEIPHALPGVSPVQVFAESARDHLLAYDLDGFNRDMPEITVPESGEIAPLRLVVRRKRGGFVSGRVLTAAGAPVLGMRVTARGPGTPDREAATDADGRFRVEGLAGATQVTLKTYDGDSGFAESSAESVSVNSTGVRLVVRKRGRMAGRVANAETGEPIADYRIRTVGYGHHETLLGQWLSCGNADGKFLLDGVRAGPVTLEVEAYGYPPTLVTVEGAAPEQTVPGVEIVLQGGWTGHARVVDASTGAPIEGALARAWTVLRDRTPLPDFAHSWIEEAEGYDRRRGTEDWWLTPSTRADEEGQIALPLMNPEGSFGLIVWAEGYAPLVRAPLAKSRASDHLSIALSRPSGLALRVLGQTERADGLSVEIRQVDVAETESASRFKARLTTDAHGEATDAALPPGQYGVLLARAEGASRRQFAYTTLTLRAGETSQVEINVDQAELEFGAVAGGENLPPSAVAWILRRSPDRAEETVGYAFVENGRFCATGLPTGPALLRLEADGVRLEVSVLISPGNTEDVDISAP